MVLRRSFGLLAVAAAAVLLGTHVVGCDVGLLHLAPALALALPLVWGRYVGEERIAGLAAAVAGWHPVRRPVRLRGDASRPSFPTPSRGGRLIAAWLAERGPPLRVAAAR